MSRYPDWINQIKKKGTSIKKVGDSYYLYPNTSKDVQGKQVSLTYVEVFECGFTSAVLSLCWIGYTLLDRYNKNC